MCSIPSIELKGDPSIILDDGGKKNQKVHGQWTVPQNDYDYYYY